MARILTEETSLTRKHKGMLRETGFLRTFLPYEFALAGVILLGGLLRWVMVGSGDLLVLGIILLGAALAHRLRIQQNVQDAGRLQAGLKGEATVTRTLDRALDNQYYIFNDHVIRSGLKRAQLDHIVVSPHGIFVIETKNWRGRIVGDVHAPRWQQIKDPGSKPLPVANPVRQVQRSCRVLALLLSRVGVPEHAMIPMVVFRSPHTVLDITGSTVPIFKPDPAARFVRDHRLTSPLPDALVDAVLSQFMGAA